MAIGALWDCLGVLRDLWGYSFLYCGVKYGPANLMRQLNNLELNIMHCTIVTVRFGLSLFDDLGVVGPFFLRAGQIF